jgi:hypothetical protein
MKKVFLVVLTIFLLTACSMGNSPTSLVESLLSKYQRLDNDIMDNIDTIIEEQNFTNEHKDRYKKILTDQYRNLSYEIKEEKIDGDNATVVTQIEVIDYRNAISDMTFDRSIYTKESFDEEKLTRLESAKDKVTYTIEFTLNKDKDGNWKLNALTNEQINKIQGMY